MIKQQEVDSILRKMAKAGYERMFDDSWDSLVNNSIEKHLWFEVAKTMLKSVAFPTKLYQVCQVLWLNPNRE